jgi:hypothetical protein
MDFWFRGARTHSPGTVCLDPTFCAAREGSSGFRTLSHPRTPAGGQIVASYHLGSLSVAATATTEPGLRLAGTLQSVRGQAGQLSEKCL